MNLLKFVDYGKSQLLKTRESLGSEYKDKPIGSFGDVAAFSFNGNKIITSGGGGAITTKNYEIGERAKFLTTTAKQPHAFEFVHNELGYNYRMPNINAALACAQLEQLDSYIEKKRNLALEYTKHFSNRGIKFRNEVSNTKANYWLMCIELENYEERDSFLKFTNDNGVMTRPIWRLMTSLPMYKKCQRDSQKNALFLEKELLIYQVLYVREVVSGVLHPKNINFFPSFVNNLNLQTFKNFDLLIINEGIDKSLLNINFKKEN